MGLNGWKIYQNLMKTSKKFDGNSNTWYFLEVDIEYPKTLLNSHNDLTFLPKRKKDEKVKKRICRIEDKEKYVVHI